jgi:hypothetical protein
MNEHVILVAVNVLTEDDRERDHAERVLITALQDLREKPSIDSWWVAEDSRTDNSDAESAVFVPKTMSQEEATQLLRSPAPRETEEESLSRYGGCALCAKGEHSPMEDEQGRLSCRCCRWPLDEHGRERRS